MTGTPWKVSLHQTFRLLHEPNATLVAFLESDGLHADDVLAALPYASSRSRGEALTPDAKRYRDAKAVYQAVGLLWEDHDSIIRLTELGQATRRWTSSISIHNAVVLGRHAAFALAGCQLRNPTGAGAGYPPGVEVFPFQFIWRAMIELDGRISSEELNGALFHASNEQELLDAVDLIDQHRSRPAQVELLPGVATGARRNDRIVPWISLASFGYTLLADKRESGGTYYTIRPEAWGIVNEAARLRVRHREFSTVGQYVQDISRRASLPKDLRGST